MFTPSRPERIICRYLCAARARQQYARHQFRVEKPLFQTPPLSPPAAAVAGYFYMPARVTRVRSCLGIRRKLFTRANTPRRRVTQVYVYFICINICYTRAVKRIARKFNMSGVWIWKINVSKCLGDRKYGLKLFCKCLIRVFQMRLGDGNDDCGVRNDDGPAPRAIFMRSRAGCRQKTEIARESLPVHIIYIYIYYII